MLDRPAWIGEPALPLGGGYIAPLWAPIVGPKRAIGLKNAIAEFSKPARKDPE